VAYFLVHPIYAPRWQFDDGISMCSHLANASMRRHRRRFVAVTATGWPVDSTSSMWIPISIL